MYLTPKYDGIQKAWNNASQTNLITYLPCVSMCGRVTVSVWKSQQWYHFPAHRGHWGCADLPGRLDTCSPCRHNQTQVHVLYDRHRDKESVPRPGILGNPFRLIPPPSILLFWTCEQLSQDWFNRKDKVIQFSLSVCHSVFSSLYNHLMGRTDVDNKERQICKT